MEGKKLFWKHFKMLSPLNKFRCVPSDKKQLYLLILWISFAGELKLSLSFAGLSFDFNFCNQQSATPKKSKTKQNELALHAMPSMSAWITAHDISGSDFSFLFSSFGCSVFTKGKKKILVVREFIATSSHSTPREVLFFRCVRQKFHTTRSSQQLHQKITTVERHNELVITIERHYKKQYVNGIQASMTSCFIVYVVWVNSEWRCNAILINYHKNFIFCIIFSLLMIYELFLCYNAGGRQAPALKEGYQRRLHNDSFMLKVFCFQERFCGEEEIPRIIHSPVTDSLP